MLTITPGSMAALRTRALPGFAEEVRAALADAYPHVLPCFPEPVQRQIVGHMLARARRWDLTHRDALYAYCATMVTVAPDFDTHPEIARTLEARRPVLTHEFAELVASLPEPIARAARRRGSTMPLFTAPESDGEPLERRLAAAIALALGDRPAAQRAPAAAAEAIALARELRLDAPDAALVMAAAVAFWGPGVLRLPWFAELRAEGWGAAEQLALVRLRLSLDFGRFI